MYSYSAKRRTFASFCLLSMMLFLTSIGSAAQKGLANASVIQPYPAATQPSIGTPLYTYQLTPLFLATGLSLDSHENVTGMATVAEAFLLQDFAAATTGISNFAVQLSDGGAYLATGSLNITSSFILADGTVGTSYRAVTLTATGGSPPYTWSVASGAFPAGLTMSSSGVISGTPSAGSPPYTAVTIQATDSTGATATQVANISIIDSNPCHTFTQNNILFDYYHGLAATNSAGGATGTFYLEKRASDSRWLWVDPCGHYYYMFSVANANVGNIISSVYAAKYGDSWSKFGRHRDMELGEWGFTGLGVYAAANMPLGGDKNSFPTEYLVRPSNDAKHHSSDIGINQAILNPVYGMACSAYKGVTRGLDAFSPLWAQAATGEWALANSYWRGGLTSSANKGWLIQIVTDDADDMQWGRALIDREYPSPAFLYLLDQFNYSAPGATGCVSGHTGPLAGSGIVSGTYVSGGIITGSAGQTCTLGSFPGVTKGTATVALTGTNTIARGTPFTVTLSGEGGSSQPTSATLSNGTAHCSGTATITSTLGWLDGNLYGKYALTSGFSGIDFGMGWGTGGGFLSNEYGTIQALNAAWGTTASGSCNDGRGGFYTSFGDDGGYGSGCGLLDEDGRHTAWLGNDAITMDCTRFFHGCIPAHPNVKTDIDRFNYYFYYKFLKAMPDAIKAPGPYQDTFHMLSPPDALGGNTAATVRPELLQAVGVAGFNSIKLGYHGGEESCIGPSCVNSSTTYNSVDMAALVTANTISGLPVTLWYSISSNPDSMYTGCGGFYGSSQYPTQIVRGQQYTQDETNWYNLTSADNSTYIIAGMAWWSLTDGNGNPHGGPAHCNGTQNGPGPSCTGENANEGLTSNCDNRYDGIADTISGGGVDTWGYSTGGEAQNEGDSIDAFKASNLAILQAIVGMSDLRSPAGQHSSVKQ